MSAETAGGRGRAGPSRAAPSWLCLHWMRKGVAGSTSFSTKSRSGAPSSFVSSLHFSPLPASPHFLSPSVRGREIVRVPPRGSSGSGAERSLAYKCPKPDCAGGDVQGMLALGKEVVLSSSRLFLFAKLLLFTCLGQGKRVFFSILKNSFWRLFPFIITSFVLFLSPC